MNRKLKILILSGAIATTFGIAQQIITQKGVSIGYLIGSAATLMFFGFLVSGVVKLFLKMFKISFSGMRFSWSVLIIVIFFRHRFINWHFLSNSEWRSLSTN